MRNTGLLTLIAAGLLHFAIWGMQHISTPPESAVSLTAINAPEIIETCHHHVHGCPADCLCPKTIRMTSEAASGDPHDDSIREPGLVACTEKGVGTHSALPDTCLSDRTSWIPNFAMESSPMPESAAPFQDWDGKPPQKVPIA